MLQHGIGKEGRKVWRDREVWRERGKVGMRTRGEEGKGDRKSVFAWRSEGREEGKVGDMKGRERREERERKLGDIGRQRVRERKDAFTWKVEGR